MSTQPDGPVGPNCLNCGYAVCQPDCGAPRALGLAPNEFLHDGEVRAIESLNQPDLAEARFQARDSDPECWCEYVDIGVGMQRVTDSLGCPEHSPIYDTWMRQLSGLNTAMSDLRLVVQNAAAQMRSMRTHTSWAFDPRCACPTPVHRMSCGVDATPKVVSK